VRERYPAQEPLLNLNNAVVSPPTRVVEQAAIEDFRLVSRNPNVNMWTLPSRRTEQARMPGRQRVPARARPLRRTSARPAATHRR
jgi:hypothetical protein